MVLRIQVKYYGRTARIAGCPGEAIDLPDDSVLTNLIEEMIVRHGPPMEQLLLTEGRELRAEAALLINGRNALYQRGLATPLHQEDKASIVALVPALKGG
jgi:molybdopterin converting factor small subunit